MSDYDFRNLNDKEFEVLTADLLSAHLNVKVERFKGGKDGGVDGRFFTPKGSEIIIQCKHWIKSGTAALIKHLEKSEVTKVKKLNPARYIFVTSLDLSRANKAKIKALFAAYIKSESDIYGQEDLNVILSKNRQVEQRNYKLWMSSTNVLKTVLNNAIVGRSIYKLQEIIESSKTYILTQSHHDAMVKLEEMHSLIITGLPGIGKTSLADQLCQFYASHGFEFCFIENSLNEAEQIYDESSKQIFYFDDFLGRNFLSALSFNQDSHVITFIKRVEKDPKKRFILTSRSTVLNQGKRLSELFYIKNIDRNEYELSITLLSRLDKAKILYNHLWFSELTEDYIEELYKDNRYHLIINHKNFNPRLISFITDKHKLKNIAPDQYWEYIESTLSNPKDIWKHVFDTQLDHTSKHVLIALVLNGKSLTEEQLRTLHSAIISNEHLTNSDSSFDDTLRLLVGAMVNRSMSKTHTSYDLFNPSIADFVFANYLPDEKYVDNLFSCLSSNDALSNLISLMKSEIITNERYLRSLNTQLQILSEEKLDNNINPYMLRLLTLSFSPLLVSNTEIFAYRKHISEVALSKDPSNLGTVFFEFIQCALSTGLIQATDKTLQEKLKSWVLEYEKDFEDFVSLFRILKIVECTSSSLTAKLKDHYVEYLSDGITQDVLEDGILRDLYDYDANEFPELHDYIVSRFEELGIEFDDTDVEIVYNSCNTYDIIESNIASAMDEDQQFEEFKERRFDNSDSSNKAINDLFQRS